MDSSDFSTSDEEMHYEHRYGIDSINNDATTSLVAGTSNTCIPTLPQDTSTPLLLQETASTSFSNEVLHHRIPFMLRKKRKKKTISGRVEKKIRKDRKSLSRRRNNHVFEITYKCATINDVKYLKSYNIGNLELKCPHCAALHFKCEIIRHTFMTCCQNGKVVLPLHKYPNSLRDLLMGSTEESDNFRENIRQYNNAVSFISFGADIKLPEGYGTYHFKVLGDTYHRSSSLFANNKNDSRYGQLYILDINEANQIRLSNNRNSKLLLSNLNLINDILNEGNPFVGVYKQIRTKLQEYEENDKILDFGIRFIHKSTDDQRRYNHPNTSEVAAIFQTNDGAPPSHRDILIYPNSGEIKTIKSNNQNIDPLTYALIWPYGEPGWYYEMVHQGTRQTKIRNKLTQREYVCYKIAIRGDEPKGDFNSIINSGKLTQQLMVDYYCRIEGERLNFIRNQQSRLRVETYIGLQDAIAIRSEQESLKIGRLVVLPSSFIGSPRNMTQNYQDAMAMVRKFGKPDIFITFTCNPSWLEIKNALQPKEAVHNRPDLIIRVFNAKVKELMNLLNNKCIFGQVKSYIYTVEFQKRGLPHVHILLTLDETDKIRSINDIDNIISAEIPDSETQPVLYDLVTTHMIHGPCGDDNPNNVCMKDGTCSKHFPKEFLEITSQSQDGYPLYKRPKNNRTFKKKVRGNEILIDNRSVVPYNPFLLKYFESHINVELCCTVKSIKYIHKYIYKGHDCINIEITKPMDDNASNERGCINYDEVKTYLNNRYVGPTESVHRILSFKMHDESHDIIRLPVHLPFQQNIYFTDDNETEALRKAEIRNTKLLAWFEMNKSKNTASPYTYPETPIHYVWNNNRWHKRKQGFNKVIGRMYNVSPSESERYFLRVLLLHVIGATSFEDLKTFQRTIYPSFKEAAIARNLLINDDEWRICLQEASTFCMPRQMRELFAYICIFQNPFNTAALWETFETDLIEDYVHHNNDQETSIQLALRDMANTFIAHNKDIGVFDLPKLSDLTIHSCSDVQLTQTSHDYVQNANIEQLQIFNEIINAIQSSNITNNAFFIDGPGGTGKTYLYKCICQWCEMQNYDSISVAWTGIAAALLPNGRTAHSTFKLPLEINETSTSSMKINSAESNFIKDAKIIIWDEASMIPNYALMCLDRLLQDIMNVKKPFGNKIIVLGGDFRQTLPVVPRCNRFHIIASCIKFSPLWKHFQVRHLTINMRCDNNAEDFSDFLLRIGNGDYPSNNSNEIELPERIIEKGDIIKSTFGDVTTADVTKVAILSPKNEHCNDINNVIVNMLPGPSRTYTSIDSIVRDDNEDYYQYPTEFLNSIEMSGLSPHSLTIKIGAVVMLIRNMNINKGFMNGTRCKVLAMNENSLKLTVIDGKGKGEIMLLPRLDLTSKENFYPFQIKRRQFPVKLSFAMTINKAQGQTFERIGIYLPEPVFSHGQLYVAMSRVRNFDQLKIKNKNNSPFVSNIVYKEIGN